MRRRQAVTAFDGDSDDEYWVDASIPSTPLDLDQPKPDFGEIHQDKAELTSDQEVPFDAAQQESDHEGSPHADDDASEPDDRQCRICFGGPEEEEYLGRLISPCFCTGSLRYVHVKCINAWRGTGTNAKAFMECPQCHHHYRLRRTLVSGLATSAPILLVLSTLLFFVLTTLTGAILHYLLVNFSSARRRLLTASTIFDTEASADGLNTWTSDHGDTLIIVGIGGSLMWDVIVSAIQTFTRIALEFADLTQDLAETWVGGILFDIGIRFILGLAVLGSFSFIGLLFSVSLYGPFHIFNTLRGIGMFRGWTRGRGEGGGRRGGLGQAVIVLFVLIGTLNTLWSVYKAVNGITQRILVIVEAQILEVNPEMRQQEKERRERRRREGWFRRWVRAGGWKTGWGWWELLVRASYALIGALKHRWAVAKEGWNRGWDLEGNEL